ncbi:M28 family peptidase [Actinomadura parmotrematis]|uniref:M28 family peptidase n=1 Tax=Actinomadura parmotrematis TaxID=2864039 RepID=A0ABS7FUC5_9ACTN|nr:M28 family peptidase [Actinomadura parmotrematis]MBW8483896.1 M28 family peptidase [Actinomadura parmotrematis]
MPKTVSRATALGGAAVLAASALVLAAPASARTARARLVAPGDVRRHLENLEAIARANGGNRASGSPGGEVSVKYVVGRLRRAGYEPVVQRFGFDFWEQKRKPVLERKAPGKKKAYKAGRDFSSYLYSGSGNVTARAVPVDVPAEGAAGTSGCQKSDFARFPKGTIAVMQRGACPFGVKAANARAAGAAAAVIYQRPGAPEKLVAGSLVTPVAMPVVGTTLAIGRSLVARGGRAVLHVRTATSTTKRRGANVIADTPGGREDNVVVAGAHLDSVPEGPGINDNGTGAAALLAIAEDLDGLGPLGVRNKVRFAWWDAEEEGLRGSSHYVKSLTPEQKARIALDLNFDMLGSPNGVRGVYDGSAKGTPAGSAAIQKVFTDYFASRGLPTARSEFDGRSDYGPFIEAGIPAGGMDTGAEKLKTAKEAQIFGGTAGKPYDACYHRACDTVGNVRAELLDTNVDGVAHAIRTLAESTLPVNGDDPAERRRVPAAPAPAEFLGGQRVR